MVKNLFKTAVKLPVILDKLVPLHSSQSMLIKHFNGSIYLKKNSKTKSFSCPYSILL